MEAALLKRDGHICSWKCNAQKNKDCHFIVLPVAFGNNLCSLATISRDSSFQFFNDTRYRTETGIILKMKYCSFVCVKDGRKGRSIVLLVATSHLLRKTKESLPPT